MRAAIGVIRLWLPVVAYMGAIFWLSSQSSIPGHSTLPAWLNHDWLHHGVAYAGLALVLLRAVSGARWAGVGFPTMMIAWLVATAFGVSDEWHQSFVRGRVADIRDVAADSVGAALALAAAWGWSIIRRSS